MGNIVIFYSGVQEGFLDFARNDETRKPMIPTSGASIFYAPRFHPEP